MPFLFSEEFRNYPCNFISHYFSTFKLQLIETHVIVYYVFTINCIHVTMIHSPLRYYGNLCPAFGSVICHSLPELFLSTYQMLETVPNIDNVEVVIIIIT